MGKLGVSRDTSAKQRDLTTSVVHKDKASKKVGFPKDEPGPEDSVRQVNCSGELPGDSANGNLH